MLRVMSLCPLSVSAKKKEVANRNSEQFLSVFRAPHCSTRRYGWGERTCKGSQTTISTFVRLKRNNAFIKGNEGKERTARRKNVTRCRPLCMSLNRALTLRMELMHDCLLRREKNVFFFIFVSVSVSRIFSFPFLSFPFSFSPFLLSYPCLYCHT